MKMMPTAIKYDLGAGITAFSTARDAVDPELPYSGFNACHYTNGDPSKVAACRNQLLGIPGVKTLVMPRQTHSLNVRFIDSYNICDPDDTDALVTNLPGVALAINTADCVPVLLADASSGVIAAAHSGWRGTAGHIAIKTVEHMCLAGAECRNIMVAMGPSLCTSCFEVGEEVAAVFREQFPDSGKIVHYPAVDARPHIDLRAAITLDLLSAGIKPQNIITTAPCSRCNWQQWWSARRMGIDSGRTLSMIMINS